MEDLIRQLAAMATQAQQAGGSGFDPNLMAAAGGNPNLPMDPASAARMAAGADQRDRIVDNILTQVSPQQSTERTKMRQFNHNGQQISLPPLANEDGNHGYWDATKMGNGQGRSFYVINGQVHYLD